MLMRVDQIISTLSYVIYSLSNLILIITDVPKNVTITYNLYTPESKDKPVTFKNVSEITLKPNRELKVLCHGWHGNESLAWYNNTIKEYLKSGNFNIITTEYQKAVNAGVNHMMPQLHTAKPIGVRIGEMLVELDVQKKVEMSKVHVVGHLLGADIAGVAGETVFSKTGKQIGRITGLDPAFHFNAMLENRLSPHDAAFVDTYSTIVGGRNKNLGKLDVYISGLMCNFWSMQSGISTKFFDETINSPKTMVGLKCATNQNYFYFGSPCPNNSTANLGEHVDKDVFGRYYVNGTITGKKYCNDSRNYDYYNRYDHSRYAGRHVTAAK